MAGNIPILSRVERRATGKLSADVMNTQGSIVKGLDAVAKGFEKASDAAFKAEELSRIADRQVRESTINDLVRNLREGYSSRKGTSASSISADFEKDFQTLADEQLDAPMSSRTQLELRAFLADKKAQLADWALNHVNQQTEKAINDADQITQNDADAELNYVSPGNYERIWEIRDEAVSKHAELGHPVETLAVVKAAYNDKLITGAFDRWYTETPDIAAKEWREQRGKLKNILSTKSYNALAQKYETEMQHVRLNAAYDDAVTKSKGNYLVAAEYALSDAFDNKHNLTHTQRMTLYHDLIGVHSNRVAQEERSRRLRDRDAMQGILKTLFPEDGSTDAENALLQLRELSRTNAVSPEVFSSVRSAIIDASWEVDRDRYTSTMMRARSGELDDYGVLQEFFDGGLGRSPAPFLDAYAAHERDVEKGRVINYQAEVEAGIRNMISVYNGEGMYPESPGPGDVASIMDQVVQAAVKENDGPVSAKDPLLLKKWEEMKGPLFKSAMAEHRKALQQAAADKASKQEGETAISVNYDSEAANMFEDFVRTNKDGKLKNYPKFEERGQFMHELRTRAQNRVSGFLRKDDPILLDVASEMLEEGWVGGRVGMFMFGPKAEGFRPDPRLTVVGEEKAVRYKTESTSQTATGGNLLQQWDENPSAIPGDSPAEKAKAYLTEAGIKEDAVNYADLLKRLTDEITAYTELK